MDKKKNNPAQFEEIDVSRFWAYSDLEGENGNDDFKVDDGFFDHIEDDIPAAKEPVSKQEEAPAEKEPVSKQEEAPAEKESVSKQEEAPAEKEPVSKLEEAPAEQKPAVSFVSYESVEQEDGSICVSYTGTNTEDVKEPKVQNAASDNLDMVHEIARVAKESDETNFLENVTAMLMQNIPEEFDDDDTAGESAGSDETKTTEENMPAESAVTAKENMEAESAGKAESAVEAASVMPEKSVAAEEELPVISMPAELFAEETAANEAGKKKFGWKLFDRKKSAEKKTEETVDEEQTKEPVSTKIAEPELTEEEKLQKNYRRKRKNLVLDMIMVVSVGVFVICVMELGWYYLKSWQYKNDMEELLDGMHGGIASGQNVSISEDNGDVLIFPDEESYEVMASVPKFEHEIGDEWADKYAFLVENNPDCIGYIEIPNTILSYPVMFTPEDPEKYLYRNFSGESEKRGTPFLAGETKFGRSQNILIYGHNMKDDMMFGTLDNYLKKSYYEDNKYIYFNTAISEGIYEIMAVCKTKIFKEADECFKFYRYGGVLTKEEFELYVQEVLKISEYKTGVTAEWGDELITLVTCNHYTENGRLIIVAKRLK